MVTRRQYLHSYLWRPLDTHNQRILSLTAPGHWNTSEYYSCQPYLAIHSHLERGRTETTSVPLDNKSEIANVDTNTRKKNWRPHLSSHERRMHFDSISIPPTQRKRQHPTELAYGSPISHRPLEIDMAHRIPIEDQDFPVEDPLQCHRN